MVHRDLSDKVYEQFIKYLAGIIITFFVSLILYWGGAQKIVDYFKSLKDKEQYYVGRQINGVVLDVLTNEPLARVRVGVVDDKEAVVWSDGDGLFSLSFRAHEDSTHFFLSFARPGYAPRTKRHSIPLDDEAEATVQKFTLEKAWVE